MTFPLLRSALFVLLFLVLRPEAGATEPSRIGAFQLTDQFGTNHSVAFPRPRPVLLLVGDRRGSEEVDAWIEPLKLRWKSTADLLGIGDVAGAPRFLRGRITDGIRKQRSRPLMLDFDGKVTGPLHCQAKTANLYVVDPEGRILARFFGLPDAAKFDAIRSALEPFKSDPSPSSPPTAR